MSKWPQQQPHSEQQWYPLMDSIQMSQQPQRQQHDPIIPTVALNNYNILSHSQQQKWHNTVTLFNGEGRSNNNSNNTIWMTANIQPQINISLVRIIDCCIYC